MNLGLMAADREGVMRLVAERRAYVIKEAQQSPEPGRILVTDLPLELEEYCLFAGKHAQLVREYQSDRGLISFDGNNAGLIGLLHMPWSSSFTANYQGWLSYLCYLNPLFETEIRKLIAPSALPEKARELNTLIVAPTGWGKSELMKALAYHYTQDTSAAVVMLDPGGDMVRQVAQWPELVRDNRAILVEPNLEPGMTVGFNPLDGTGIDDEETRTLVASDWAQIIGDLTSDLSSPMLNMAQNCIHVLLADKTPGGATFTDFKLLLTRRERKGNQYKPPVNHRHAQLLNFAENYPLPRVKHYFKHDFSNTSLDSTRSALSNRLGRLLGLPYVEAMFCGPASFNLEKSINERKFVLFNLARFGRQGSSVVGKLLIGYLGTIGRRRESLARSARIPTHIFIDEATTLASPAMLENLNQLRKFGLHQTLAQQVEGDGFDSKARKVLKANTRCKFYAGPVGDISSVLELRESADELPALYGGQFYVQWPGRDYLGRLAVTSGLADDQHRVSDEAWRIARQRMVREHYRSADFERPAMVFDEEPELLAPLRQPPRHGMVDFLAGGFTPSPRTKAGDEPEIELPADKRPERPRMPVSGAVRVPTAPEVAKPAQAAPQRATSPAGTGRRPKSGR